jgi:CubicO group peptidase (beta-lactamase class C family)
MRAPTVVILPILFAGLTATAGSAGAQNRGAEWHECLPGAPFPCSTAEDEDLDPFVLETFMSDAAWWVEQGRIAGAELLVIRNGHIVWHRAVGWSDRERGTALERNSIYRIRSMTKPFTGAAILMLMEEGRLDLDDLVSSYLPSFDNERSRDITIREALTHGSGFEQSDFPPGYWESPDLRSAVELIGERGPPYPPGETFRYSDHNSAILGAIVAQVTGAPVEDFIQRRILDPLGLRDTHAYFAPDSSWAARTNATYGTPSNGRLVRYWDPTMNQQTPWFRASGGLYSTVYDYARWLAVWMDLGAYDGGRLLQEGTVREALEAGYSPSYGMHWQRFAESGDPAELPRFGHTGSDGTIAIAFPERNAMVLYFTQSRGARLVWDEAMRRIPALVGAR